MSFLDTAGLEYFWQQIIARLGNKADVSSLEDGSITVAKATNATSMRGVTASSDDGVAYTATVDGITELTAGVSFIMIPSINSTSTTPTLNVNGLGAKGLRMRGSTATSTAITASIEAWLASGRPIQVTYNGFLWVTEVTRPAATDLTGTVAIANGGTGATTAATALVNLGMPSAAEVGQTVVVKSIDEDGMPTEWEAADLGTITIDENGDAWFGSSEEVTKLPEGIPEYTTDDEGKFLGIVNGTPSWADNGAIVVSDTEPTDSNVMLWVQI